MSTGAAGASVAAATNPSAVYILYIMKRTQIYLDDDQDGKLARRASLVGVTKSRLIREAINAYLDPQDTPDEQFAEFLRAVEEIAESPASFPDGATYVEELRAAD